LKERQDYDWNSDQVDGIHLWKDTTGINAVIGHPLAIFAIRGGGVQREAREDGDRHKNAATEHTKRKEEFSDHGRDRTCNLLIPIVAIVVKRLAIGPRGRCCQRMFPATWINSTNDVETTFYLPIYYTLHRKYHLLYV
jgi:hypothetical protein